MSKKKNRPSTSAPVQEPVEGKVEPSPSRGTAAPMAQGPAVSREPFKWWLPLIFSMAFFLITLLTTASTIKPLVMGLIALVLVSGVIRLSTLVERLSWPLIGVSLWILMNGISMFYANSGKFALQEFLRLMVGFCVFLLILLWSGKEKGGRGRLAASMLEGGSALAALFSIDMLSTHWLSAPLFRFLQIFSQDYTTISSNPIEIGVRMNSLFENPNVFAGVAGLGVLLSLELAVTAERKEEKPFHLVCLFLNALSFLLVFSMGASGMICLAFLVLLLLEQRERKVSLILLMLETLVIALLSAFPIFRTAFQEWTGFQPLPLLCALGGAALLCLADRFVGQKLSQRLALRGRWLIPTLVLAILLLLAGFAALAVTQTGPAALAGEETLRRAEYPDPGTYTLDVQATGPLTVTIESQNQQETMMHTETTLYSGDAAGAVFTVPEGSLVTYFTFRAGEALTVESASIVGPEGSTALKLHYKLLPGFIANRLQGLFANENAIQRVVFFADGMKLFRRSPVFGLGLGSYENSVKGVQSFYYETKHSHNHYVETLVCTGVVGLILFVGMLALCALAVWKSLRRGSKAHPLAPALGAALVFMAGHAGVEVIFSFCSYLPMALGVMGLICLCCGGELPLPGLKKAVRSGCAWGLYGLIALFAVTLGMNMSARQAAETNSRGCSFRTLAYAARLDPFEKNDYMLSYIVMAQMEGGDQSPEILATANQYAQRLSQVDSNSIPPYLANYYFTTGQPENAVAALKKYVDFVSADSKTWQTTFDILARWAVAYPQCQTAAAEIYQMFQSWNQENMGDLALTEANLSYIATVLP